MKATDTIRQMNIRQIKAQQIASLLMRTLDDIIPRACQREAYEKMMELLMTEGIEILTDEDRRRAGLPPRGPDGWTAAELHALEYARLYAISAQIAMALRPTEQTSDKPSDIAMSDGRKAVGKASENSALDTDIFGKNGG